ncbi:MAG: hypothetical protein R3362_12970, partial [Rhodothermales bacterium]|nr:hypothetical protein [Rhodothermales bacterium]
MSTLNAPKTISRRSDRREDRVMTAYARAVDYADKNRQVVYLAAGALLVLLLGIVGYALLQNRNAANAQVLLGQALPLYEQGEYRAALDGSGDAPGLLEIADEYGGTKAGNLARFYAADALYRLGEHEEALRWFEAFDVDDNIVGASALAGQAAIHEDREAYDRAGDLYRRAALVFDHE